MCLELVLSFELKFPSKFPCNWSASSPINEGPRLGIFQINNIRVILPILQGRNLFVLPLFRLDTFVDLLPLSKWLGFTYHSLIDLTTLQVPWELFEFFIGFTPSLLLLPPTSQLVLVFTSWKRNSIIWYLELWFKQRCSELFFFSSISLIFFVVYISF